MSDGCGVLPGVVAEIRRASQVARQVAGLPGDPGPSAADAFLVRATRAPWPGRAARKRTGAAATRDVAALQDQ